MVYENGRAYPQYLITFREKPNLIQNNSSPLGIPQNRLFRPSLRFPNIVTTARQPFNYSNNL